MCCGWHEVLVQVHTVFGERLTGRRPCGYHFFVFRLWFLFSKKWIGHQVVMAALLLVPYGALTACGVNTVQPDLSTGDRVTYVDNDNADSNASTTREVGEPVSEGDVVVVDDAPAATEGETFLGWETGDGELMQPGDDYTVGAQPPVFKAVHHPTEPADIVLSDVRAGSSLATNPGFALDVDGLAVAVGARYTAVEGQASGSVDLVRWNGSTWLHETRLTVEDL